jgi:hypothetical protein
VHLGKACENSILLACREYSAEGCIGTLVCIWWVILSINSGFLTKKGQQLKALFHLGYRSLLNLLKRVSFFLVLIKYTPVNKTAAAMMDCAEIVSFKKYHPKIKATIGFT